MATDPSGQKNSAAAVLQYAAQLCEFLILDRCQIRVISSQTGDSIKTLESDYAKYIKEADDNSDFVENQIQKVQPK
jgi:hypothetical protein